MDFYYQSILRQAEKLYNAKSLSENTLGNSANTIFEMIMSDEPFILRVSEYKENKKEHIDFELNWMNYLSSEINNIAKPIKSVNKNLNEIIDVNDKKYILCAFEKAKGKTVNSRNQIEFNETLFSNLGSIMGHMHRLTMAYNDYDDIIADKFAWYNSALFWPEYNIVIDDEIQPFAQKYVDELHSLSKSKETYGIIHEDIHEHNFFVDSGHITIFDFDDCQFNWYAYDIAATLYQLVQSAMPFQNAKEREEFAATYLLSYLKGYSETNAISKYWICKLDMFMKYRRTGSYKFIQNIFKDHLVNPHEGYLHWLKKGILSDTPFVYIDYQKIIDSTPSIRT